MSRHTLQRAPDPHAAPPVGIATRRDLFGTMGALLLLTAAEAGPAKAAELDGDLLSLCDEAMAIEGESDRLWQACRDVVSTRHSPAWAAYEAHTDATQAHLHDLLRQAAATPARTPEGLRAKARIALAVAPCEAHDDPDPWERVTFSLCRDVLGRAGA